MRIITANIDLVFTHVLGLIQRILYYNISSVFFFSYDHLT